ncbi:transposase, IS30 family [Marininema halotolerans]|uniref:Transposase, IS30 family n=1 Tax=Marininema halotolerans TaxID=1155944 RepID=A0A1I6P6A5_9BACL|nr:transposase, IS30 family [Marininema halotolerans]
MGYSHLTTYERGQLATLHELGWSTRAIENLSHGLSEA